MKTFTGLVALPATASAREGNWYSSQMKKQLRYDRCTNNIVLVFLRCYHNWCISCCGLTYWCNDVLCRSTLAVSLSQSGIIHGMRIHNGWAFALQRCGILSLHNPNLAIKDCRVSSSLCKHAGCSDDNNDAYYFEYY